MLYLEALLKLKVLGVFVKTNPGKIRVDEEECWLGVIETTLVKELLQGPSAITRVG